MPAATLRPRPLPNLSLVFYPQRDGTHVHFAEAAAHPFDAGANALGRRNAWWLAEAALLSYWAPADVKTRYAAVGFSSEAVFAGTTQAYLAWNEATVIVTFRGTEPGEAGDTLDDLAFAIAPWDHAGTHVHAGFKIALNRVWPQLSDRLRMLSASRSVWFAGHSLGAALATLAADRYGDAKGLCTLGGPRVGDMAFAVRHGLRFGARSLRYVNDADIITHLPPPVPYRHTGEARFIDSAGLISEERPDVHHFFKALIGNPGHLREVLRALHSGALHEAPDFLLDHMPRAYAAHIWNDYARNGD